MDRRWLVLAGFLGASFAAAAGAVAAEITDVADAADTVRIGTYERSKLFSLYLDDSFEFLSESGKITREPINLPNRSSGCSDTTARACAPIDELRYARTTMTYHVRGQVGLYQDLALTFGWSYVVNQSTTFRYANGVNAANSTVDSSDPAVGTLFPHNFKSTHKGSGAVELGLRFAPLSDERDESKPMWVLAFNWAAPWAAKTYNPAKPATKSDPGSVGDGINYLTFSTALSKRLGDFGTIATDANANRRGYLDPYIEVAYVYPSPGGQALAPLASGPFARSPSQQVKLSTGFEVVPYEDLRGGHKLAFDFGLRSTMFTAGRNYSELTDPLGRLTYTDPYLYVGGILAMYVQLAPVMRLKLGATVGYNTPHLLTNEKPGGAVPNPYYCGPAEAAVCARGALPYDQVGMRFRDQEHLLWGGFGSLMFTF